MKNTVQSLLKKKARIAGKLRELDSLFITGNKYVNQRNTSINTSDVYDEYNDLVNQLIEVKTQIAQANVHIASKLVALSELKSQLNTLKRWLTCSGINHQYTDPHGNVNTVMYGVKDDVIRDHIDYLEKDIDKLQSEIDHFNATHTV